MLELIIVNLGLTWFVLTALEEFKILNWFQLRAPNRYYEKLLSCNFCLSLRFSTIILIPFLIFDEFQFAYLFVPLVIGGITSKF